MGGFELHQCCDQVGLEEPRRIRCCSKASPGRGVGEQTAERGCWADRDGPTHIDIRRTEKQKYQ